MKLEIKDRVETGHDICTGGTLSITVTFNFNPVYEEIYQTILSKKTILNIIDKLDHCLIAHDEELVNYSKRFYLLQSKLDRQSPMLLIEAAYIIFNELKNYYEGSNDTSFLERAEVTVQLDKELVVMSWDDYKYLDCCDKIVVLKRGEQ